MSFLLDPWREKAPTGQDLNMLQGDCQLIVVAGRSCKLFRLLPIVPQLMVNSDTTASTLTSLLYELVKSPTEASIYGTKSALISQLEAPYQISHCSI